MEPADCLKVLTRSVFCIILAQLKLTHYPGVCSRKHLLHARRRRPETPVTPPANRDRSAGRFAHYMGNKNFLHGSRAVRVLPCHRHVLQGWFR